MESIKSVDDVLKDLGLDPSQKATVAFKMWQPWNRDDAEHAKDPQGFVGVYGGYKIAEKQQMGDRGSKSNVFDVFSFADCNPGPDSGESGWAVSSGFMLEELKKVNPGTMIAIVYEGSEKNAHGGSTRNIAWYFANPADKKTQVASIALPPSNAASLAAEGRAALPANGHIPF
jgi:hypothetical protein